MPFYFFASSPRTQARMNYFTPTQFNIQLTVAASPVLLPWKKPGKCHAGGWGIFRSFFFHPLWATCPSGYTFIHTYMYLFAGCVVVLRCALMGPFFQPKTSLQTPISREVQGQSLMGIERGSRNADSPHGVAPIEKYVRNLGNVRAETRKKTGGTREKISAKAWIGQYMARCTNGCLTT